MADRHAVLSCHQARAFAGLTLGEYADFITRFPVHEADGIAYMFTGGDVRMNNCALLNNRYRSSEQIRNGEMLTLHNPPLRYDLPFEGVETNADGLIAEADLLALFDRAIGTLDKLEDSYTLSGAT